MDEDCLHLNVWSRAELAMKNCQLWFGSTVVLCYWRGCGLFGAELTKKGVVLVTINYRLGLFGYLAHSELSAQHQGCFR